jgi:1,4-alpha-glucan branching enzyme
VLVFHRWDRGGPGDDVVLVANFSSVGYPSYNIGFPRPGAWRVRFNSDARVYSPRLGDFPGYDTTAGPGGNMGMPFNGNVGLGPYTCLILSQ